MIMRSSGLVALAGLLLTACAEKTTEQPTGTDARLSVYSVNYPLHYFAQRIGGEDVDAVFPAPADMDPAFWMPAPDTVAEYQDADLILLNGAGYARWVSLATLRETRMIDTSSAFQDRYIELEATLTHTHGPQGDHSHAGFAFTTWLDLQLAKLQAQTIADTLSAARPTEAAEFEVRYRELAAELDALDGRLAAAVEQLSQTPVLFSHPVYQYLQRRYGLNGASVHWEPDEEPSTQQWRELEQFRTSHGPRWMIWEAEPRAETRAELEARGIGSLVFSPAANDLGTGDFLEVMDAQISALEAAATRP